MTFESAVAILAHARRDAEEVVQILLKLATLAHVTGNYRNRDDSVDSAGELIAHCARLPRRSRFDIPRS
jgi:hypothetical protein